MAKIAVIETGGKQYVVSNGSVIDIEKVTADADGKVVFDAILLIDDGKVTQVGVPTISGASVTAQLIRQAKAKKITVIRYRQKSRYFKKKGHRQTIAKVKIIALP